MEENGNSESLERAISLGTGLDVLYLAVQAFCRRIGDMMLKIIEKPFQMSFEHVGDFDESAIA
jgi:hypothetical protein